MEVNKSLEELSDLASEAESELLEYAETLRSAVVSAVHLPSAAEPYYQKASQLRERIASRGETWERALAVAWERSAMGDEPLPEDHSLALERLAALGGPEAKRLVEGASRLEALTEAVSELETANDAVVKLQSTGSNTWRVG